MPEIQELLDEFIERALNKEKFYSLYGTVKSVNESDRTCVVTPIGDEPDQPEVRLQGDIGSKKGVVLIPKVGSVVGVTFVNSVAGFISLYTDIDKVIIEATKEVSIDTVKTVFNGGLNGGLINISSLVTKMNILENDLNLIKGIFAGWVPTPGDGGLVLKTASTPWSSAAIVPTLQPLIEDTKVKH